LRTVAKEREIQAAILEFLAVKKVFSFRLNSGGFGGSHKGKKWFVKPHSLGKGASDIVAFPRIHRHCEVCGEHRCGSCGERHSATVCLWLEIKRDGAKPSPEQLSFGKKVTDEGHYYIVARSVDDVRLWLSQHSGG
jgi:hypothetical protein